VWERKSCTGRVMREKENTRGTRIYFARIASLKSASSVRMQWPDSARRAFVLSDLFEQVVTNQIKAASR